MGRIGVEAVASVNGVPPSPHPHGLALSLDDGITGDGVRRLRASARALQPCRLDAVGVRLHVPEADRLLGDGYHSWDWAGLRDFHLAGSAWWGAIVGSVTSSWALRLRLEQPPDQGALRLAWDGRGTLDLLTTGPPDQAWERSGPPTRLGNLAAGSLTSSDAVLLSELDPDSDTGAALPRLAAAPPPGPRQVGWMSWNCLGPLVTAGDARAALELVPAGGVVLVDDGWEQRWGDWVTAARFGATLADLAAELGGKGAHLGCWLAPFLADPSSDILAEHPGWMLRDDRGQPVVDLRPALPQHILDASLPEVLRHLAETGERLARSGVAVLKLDFLYAGAVHGRRARGWTGMRALRAGAESLVEAFRGAAGPAAAVWLCGAPAPPLVGLGDACRSGGDGVIGIPGLNASPLPSAPFVHGPALLSAQERNLAARAWLWGTTLPPDADAVSLGRLGASAAVDDAGAQRWLALAERSGGPLLIADVELTPERQRLLSSSQQRVVGRPPRPARTSRPLGGIPAPPEDDHFLSQPEA